MLLVLGSLTEPLVRLATNLIASLGLGGVALLTMTSGVIGLPGSEPTMLFAGFDVFKGNLTLPGIITAGVLGDMVVSCSSTRAASSTSARASSTAPTAGSIASARR